MTKLDYADDDADEFVPLQFPSEEFGEALEQDVIATHDHSLVV
jgi:hypothetical protein